MHYRVIFLGIFFVFLVCGPLFGQKDYSGKTMTEGLDQLILDKQKKKSDEGEHNLLVSIKEELLKQRDSIKLLNEQFMLSQQQLNSALSRPPIFVPCKVEPPLTNIRTAVWTSRHLSKEDLYGYFGLKEIKEARNDEDWEEAFLNNRPAFCYHKLDKSKEFGILFNVPALSVLKQKLGERESVFRLPNADDIQKLNELGRTLKLTPLQLFSLNNDPKNMFPFSWKTPGMDLFQFELPALSYRRNLEDDEWHGGNAASFYCDDPKDPQWNNGIILAELSAESQKWELLPGMITKGDYSNIGTYIRLLYR